MPEQEVSTTISKFLFEKLNEPMIQQEKDRLEFIMPNQVNFKNFDEKEESTIILTLTILRFSQVKAYFLLPILSILTLLVLPIRLYWSAELRAKYMYN